MDTTKEAVTAMDSGLYRKNVMKTLSIKPAKLGLSITSRNTERTNVHHAIAGVVSESLEFLSAMRPYMVGEQINKVNLLGADGVKIELGDIGYYLQVLAKTLKTKAVSAKKKIKLQGTLTARILDLMLYAEQLADLNKKTYYGAKMMEIERAVRNPATAEISQKMVPVVDKEAETAAWEERKAKIQEVLTPMMELHAELCLAILGTPTGPVNLGNIQKLQLRYPNASFELEAQEKKDAEAEAAAAA